MLFVFGVDPARKGFHQLSVMIAETREVIIRQKVKGNQALITEIKDQILQLNDTYTHVKVILGIEHQENVLRLAAQELDLPIYSINAAKLSYHNKAVNLGEDKSDVIDADAVCHYLAAHFQKLTTYQPRSDLDEEAYCLSRQLDCVRKQKTQVWQRFWCVADSVVPDLKDVLEARAKNLWFLNMIEELFSKNGFKHTGIKAFTSYCSKKQAQGKPEFFGRLLDLLKEAHCTKNVRCLLPLHARMLLALLSEEKLLVKSAEETVLQWEYGVLLSSIPCMKAKTIVRLQAHFGSKLATVEPPKLCAYSGLAPVLKQSGTPRRKDLRKMSPAQRKRYEPFRIQRKACNHDLQSAMLLFTFVSLLNHPWAKNAYDRYKHRGQTHYEALRNVGMKWMKIIHAMARDHKPYDMYSHQQNIQKHQDPLNAR